MENKYFLDLEENYLLHIKREIITARLLQSYVSLIFIHSEGLKRMNEPFWSFLYLELYDKYFLTIAKLWDSSNDKGNLSFGKLARFFRSTANKHLNENENKSINEIIKEIEITMDGEDRNKITTYRDKLIAHIDRAGFKIPQMQPMHAHNLLDKAIEIHKRIKLDLYSVEETYELTNLNFITVEGYLSRIIELNENDIEEK